ncbi:MAG TPA: hypothetical protein VNN17_02445, partial [Terriglobia bacterium]|nr:hypothetical protein [Terriglobia bacterium]
KAKAAADPYQYISRGGVPLPGELGTNYWSNLYGTNAARAYGAAAAARTNATPAGPAPQTPSHDPAPPVPSAPAVLPKP